MTGCDHRARDLRTREGRAYAVMDAVWSGECTLPPPARLLVASLAIAAHEREATTAERLGLRMSCTRRTVRKYYSLLSSACGEDPAAFIRDVVERRRSPAEWFRALELHGGRHSV